MFFFEARCQRLGPPTGGFSVTGSFPEPLFGLPRFIQIKGINIDAEIGAHMLYTTNEDVPGIIGLLGMTMGKNNVNIANFTLGRSGVGQDAIAILYLDQPIDPKVIETLEGTGMFQQVKALQFDIA